MNLSNSDHAVVVSDAVGVFGNLAASPSVWAAVMPAASAGQGGNHTLTINSGNVAGPG